jgi:hypothetical protein
VTGSCEHGNEPSGSINARNSCVAELLLASQEGLSSMELVMEVMDVLPYLLSKALPQCARFSDY